MGQDVTKDQNTCELLQHNHWAISLNFYTKHVQLINFNLKILSLSSKAKTTNPIKLSLS